MLSVLGGDEPVMIHPKFRHMPFGRIMSQQKGRVGVLWNAVEVSGVTPVATFPNPAAETRQ